MTLAEFPFDRLTSPNDRQLQRLNHPRCDIASQHPACVAPELLHSEPCSMAGNASMLMLYWDVAQLLKDPYIFDFLTLEKPFHERELETGLLRHLQDFLVELGTGFAFVGRQVHMEVGDDDFYIDLLFYHLHLRCFIVIDLKVGKFKAEYAGKMNFYLNAVDDRMKATSRPSA